MSKIPVTILLFFFLFRLSGQNPVGTWSDHLVYNTARNLAIGQTDVYASTGSSIIVYNKSLAELRKLSHINGLTGTGIDAIGWSQENEALVIGYTSTNIDLVINNVIYNIPDIERKYIAGEKRINRIRTNGKYAYLACSFGIAVVDLVKKEIYDTWKPGAASGSNEVFDIAFGNGSVYAATENGAWSASLSNPGLSFSGNWDPVNYLPSPGKCNLIMYAGGRLYVNRTDPLAAGDSVYTVDGGNSLFLYEPGVYYRSLEPSASGFTVSSSSAVKYYDLNGSLRNTINSYGWGTVNISHAIEEGGDIWIADISSGLVLAKNMNKFTSLVLPGPVSNSALNISSHNGKTLITEGGVTSSWNNQAKLFRVSVNENNNWSSFSSPPFKDAMRALIDPADNNHFFVSSWGGGLFEYRENKLFKQYTDANSPLQTIIPGAPYVRVCGLAMDDDRNLWITQTEVPGSIKMLKPDGTWAINYDLTINAPTIGDIIIASNGYKWVILPRGFGLFVLDDNGTPENFTDDRSVKTLVRDNENRIISNVYSIACDLDENIWVGTDQGPVIYYTPERIFEENFTAFRIKIPRNDGTDLADYMLGTEKITSIAIDGANRKWLGTSASGAYLLSPDGTSQIHNFNELNSPMLSNNITSISVDNKTGEVWIGTSKGVQSYRGNAIDGGEKFSGVYSFPNPVREDFPGNVTVTGLVRNTQVKITDISGNLVFETMSDGGMATWDLNNYKGQRVSTGVFMVFCASPDGKSVVTKILVVR